MEIEQKKETTLDKVKKWKDLILILLLLLLFVGNVFLFNKVQNQSKDMEHYESAISAINDSIKITIKDGFTNYSQKTPEIDLKTLINSEFFKTLSADQKKFYNDLKQIKGLISATNAEMSKHGELLDELLIKDSKGIVKGDSISFALGTPLSFNEKDTTKKLQWKAGINIDNPIRFKMEYDYKFNILTTFERQKDKSILVNYKIDDPDLKVNKMMNFTIPQEENKTVIGRWVQKNKKPLLTIGGFFIFSAGMYTGISIVK